MEKTTKATSSTVKEEVKKEGKAEPKVINKEVEIKNMLKRYNELEKKSFGEGRRIRRKLRRLGYYLSKQEKPKTEKEEKK